MSWYNKVLNFFVRDSAERRKFINDFNSNAQRSFQNLSVDALFIAEICEGSENETYRHDLSAPRFASGIEIKVCGGANIPLDDIILIGRIILLDGPIVRRMYILHWDTLIIRDIRTNRSVDWRIKDFIHLGGMRGCMK